MFMENNNFQSEKDYLKRQYQDIFKLKNNDFFGLLDIKFYLKEFLFFPEFLTFLASRHNLDDNKAQNLGIVSTLVYLSAKIHFSVHDENEHYASSMQFPILLGDLLYGKVIETLMSSPYSDYLKDYLAYLQKLNAAVIDYLNGKISKDTLDDWRFSKLALLSAALLGVEDEQELALAAELANAFAASLNEENFSLTFSEDELNKHFTFLQSTLKITSLDELCQNID